jgi:hypothetical protein
MNRQISMRIGIAGIALCLVFLLLSHYFFRELAELFRVYLTPDNHLNAVGEAKLRLAVYFLVACIFFMSLLFFFNLINKLIERMPLQQLSNDISRIFYQDPVCARKNIGKHFFLVGSGLAIIIQLSMLAFGEPQWEGPADKYSPILYVVAAILVLIASANASRLNIHLRLKRKIRWGLVILSGLFLLIYGEEVSWGQQFFEIETSELFKLNYQQENTIHNFFNPLFKYAYPFVGFSSFIVLSYFWLINKPTGLVTNLFLPHVSLYLFFLLMAGSTYTGNNEPYEVFLAIFSVLYAIRLMLCIKNPGELFFKKADAIPKA